MVNLRWMGVKKHDCQPSVRLAKALNVDVFTPAKLFFLAMLLFSIVEYFIAVRQGRVFCQRCIFHIMRILLISYICISKASATLFCFKSLVQY